MSEAIKRAKTKSDTRAAIVAVLVFVMAAVTSSWGACSRYSSYDCVVKENGGCKEWACSLGSGGYCLQPALPYTEECINSNIPSNAYRVFSAKPLTDPWGQCGLTNGYVGRQTGSLLGYRCSTQAEADSVKCVMQDGQWVNGSCKITQDDTETMEKVVEQCDKVGGEPDFRYNDQGNVVGSCNICGKDENGNYTSPVVQRVAQDLKKECCGRLGEFGDAVFKCDPQGGGCYGADCDWAASGYNAYSNPIPNVCDLGAPLDPATGLPASCEEFADTTSGGGGGDSPNSSSSEEAGSSGSAGPEGLEGILDSLHRIIVYDSISNDNEDVIHWDLVEVIKELQKDKKDTFNINIAGDTIIVKPADVHFNPTIQGDTIIVNNDSLAGAIQALAEAMANIRGDSSGVYSDSALMAAIWGDTAGHSLGDTSGWGDSLGWLQGKIDSLGLGAGAYGDCDTTGGNTCDEQYIGKDGLATATGKYKGLAKDLRDSVLENGPVHDSVQAWSNLFKSEKLSGGGSNTCPTILTKTWNVDFKLTQVEIGPLGKYVCSPIMGNITPWQVGRTLLRALVAIACMWWLFRQAMGVSGGSSDEED